MINNRMQNVAVVTILICGGFLLTATVALCVMVYQSTQETITNREIGCISRYLDGQKFAPQCEEYIDDFR